MDKRSTVSSKYNHEYPRSKNQNQTDIFYAINMEGKEEKQGEKELDNEVEDKEKP